MPTNHTELGFEEYIEQHLLEKNNYIKRVSQDHYDKDLCLDKKLVLQFIKNTQPKIWEKLESQHGQQAEDRFFKRLTEEIKARGLLDVIRDGITDHGVSFDLAYFKPNTRLNEETQRLFESNIFSIIRQLKYSQKNENSIDMGIFLNGIPIYTIELKNQLTGQTVKNGMNQYRNDRDPKEPLLAFKRCLVHFAVDTELVYMSTKLAGLKTFFLPFNKGNKTSAGNPPNPHGYKTAYVWEDIWTRDTTLEVINRFMHLQKEEKTDAKGRKYVVEKLLFPRYHQLDVVKKLIEDTRANGAGKNYLIQHSAGSGKSNSIAWSAHHLAELHDEDDKKVFDSVIIVTDRRVLDKQLQDTVSQFEQVRGVVKSVTEGSAELKKALEHGEKIIITTLQKFPVIVRDMQEIRGKKFAVIIDEAHSSQTGESAKSLKQVLNTSLDDAEKADEANELETLEDKILKEVRSRGKMENISFLAFTATPKQKTLEIFGVQNPVDEKFYPFHLYSMKQAIEERFILDVLKNYTTYKVYFNLLKKINDDPEYKKKKATRLMMNYVDKHEHAIAKKVQIIVEHFWNNIAQEIDGKSKAMIVTKSRLHAVKFKQAVDEYINKHNLPIKALVAFSGTVSDGDMEYTEAFMNGVPEKNTAEEFKKDEYKFLIVAEKFQTGFDQPLLSAMYVDKQLGGVNAVQTLSRLNRTCADKKEVFVLDFINETDDIQASFQPYYTTTILSKATDPNILHNLQRDILNYKIFSEQEVGAFVEMFFQNVPPSEINSFLDVLVPRFEELEKETQEECRSKISDYTKKYAFISQIMSFEDTNLEKLYIFLRFLRKKLPVSKEEFPTEILEGIDMESFKITKKGKTEIKLENEETMLEPIEGSGRGQQEEAKEALSRIIKDVNDRFGTEFSTEDRVILNNLSSRLIENQRLKGTIENNPKDSAKIKFDEVFQEELVSMFNSNFKLYEKLESNAELKAYVNERVYDFVHKKLKK